MKQTHLLALVTAVALLLAINMPVRASETDNRIESSFLNSYVYKTYLAEDQINISSNDGAVILSGTVRMDFHKTMAQDTAEALPGVKSVDNLIKITEDHPAENSDMWVTMKVKSALLYHRNVSGSQTDVEVNQGVVTLRGEAVNQAQKDLTTEYVKDVVGVERVNNEMTVAASSTDPQRTLGEVIDDASITAQVKGALLFHRSTSVLKTGVTTKDGVVTISGEAKNEAEKTLAAKLVTDIRGVTSVVNNMTVVK